MRVLETNTKISLDEELWKVIARDAYFTVKDDYYSAEDRREWPLFRVGPFFESQYEQYVRWFLFSDHDLSVGLNEGNGYIQNRGFGKADYPRQFLKIKSCLLAQSLLNSYHEQIRNAKLITINKDRRRDQWHFCLVLVAKDSMV